MDAERFHFEFGFLNDRKQAAARKALQMFEKNHVAVPDYRVCRKCLREISDHNSIEDMAKSMIETQALYQELKHRPLQSIGENGTFGIGETVPHFDCPVPFEVKINEEVVATVGVFVGVERDTRTLRITNVQGVGGRKETLESLSRTMGENWRVDLVKRMKAIAEEHHLKPVGVLPMLFFNIGPTLSPQGYKRLLRQYHQAYRKAGILEIDRHKVKPYPEKYRKIWRESRRLVRQLKEGQAPLPLQAGSRPSVFSRMLRRFSRKRRK